MLLYFAAWLTCWGLAVAVSEIRWYFHPMHPRRCAKRWAEATRDKAANWTPFDP